MDKELRKALVEWGQYRDVEYIPKDGEVVVKRCLIIPAVVVEPLIKK